MARRSLWILVAGVTSLAVVVLVSPAGSKAAPAADRLITSTSMGAATIGSTQAQLDAALDSSYTIAPVANPFVDLTGFEVTRAGTRQFFALHVSGGGPQLHVLVTDNPEYQTAEMIGPGSTIEQAVAVYGAATVSYNTNAESREFAAFASGPAGRIRFQVLGPDGSEQAGNYTPPLGELNETTDVKAGSKIVRVWVDCVPGSCPAVPATPTTPGFSG